MTGVGAGSPGDPANMASNPSLAQIATQYFPGQVAVPAQKRVFRLTRTQLDNTTKALLPDAVDARRALDAPPIGSKPTTSYSDNLEFNPSNFTPLVNWVAEIAARVKANPTSVIDCAPSNDSTACLAEQAKRFVGRAFRGTLTDAELTRCTTFFTESAEGVGVPAATADLVDVTLTSPRYLFRDEVATDASGALRPRTRCSTSRPRSRTHPGCTRFLVRRTRHVPAIGRERASDHRRRARERRGARQAAPLLHRLARGQAGGRVHDFEQRVPGVHGRGRGRVVDETSKFLERQLGGAAPRMKDLTESAQGFVLELRRLLYGHDVQAGSLPVELDPAQRLGIFTQPAVIASHSGPTTSRLVKRGVFFVRKVMCMPLGSPPPGTDTTVPDAPSATERERVECVTAKWHRATAATPSSTPSVSCSKATTRSGAIARREEGGAIDANISVDFLDEGRFEASSPVAASERLPVYLALSAVLRASALPLLLGPRRDSRRRSTPRQMFFDFANEEKQDIVRLLRTLAGAPAFLGVRRFHDLRSVGRGRLSRRDLIKSWSAAFLLFRRALDGLRRRRHPSPARRASSTSSRGRHTIRPPSIRRSPSRACLRRSLLAPHAEDLVLFTGMSIHGGSPKTDGYQEEHAAGLIGCATGNDTTTRKDDSYYAVHRQRVDRHRHCQRLPGAPALSALPFASLHLGVGAHSDADNVGLGQRYISYRKRQSGDSLYGNADRARPGRRPGVRQLMQRINVLCSQDSNPQA